VCLCSGRNEAVDAADRERFLQELEEDAEMRARVALFKDPAAAAAAAAGGNAMAETDDSDDDGDLPQVRSVDGSCSVCIAAVAITFGMSMPTVTAVLLLDRCRWRSCWTTWRASTSAARRSTSTRSSQQDQTWT
jgi:hypothetical protein